LVAASGVFEKKLLLVMYRRPVYQKGERVAKGEFGSKGEEG